MLIPQCWKNVISVIIATASIGPTRAIGESHHIHGERTHPGPHMQLEVSTVPEVKSAMKFDEQLLERKLIILNERELKSKRKKSSKSSKSDSFRSKSSTSYSSKSKLSESDSSRSKSSNSKSESMDAAPGTDSSTATCAVNHTCDDCIPEYKVCDAKCVFDFGAAERQIVCTSKFIPVTAYATSRMIEGNCTDRTLPVPTGVNAATTQEAGVATTAITFTEIPVGQNGKIAVVNICLITAVSVQGFEMNYVRTPVEAQFE